MEVTHPCSVTWTHGDMRTEGTRRDATWAQGATRPCHCVTWGRRGQITVMSPGLTVTRGHHTGAIAMSHEDGGDT